MNHIFAYVGHNSAYPILINGIKRIAGASPKNIGIGLSDSQFSSHYGLSSIKELLSDSKQEAFYCTSAIGQYMGQGDLEHINPVYSYDNKLMIVSCGELENYDIIKKALIRKGITLVTELDSEALVNFIRLVQEEQRCALEYAVRIALKDMIGSYAFALISRDIKDQIIAASRDQPLMIGKLGQEVYLSTDANSIQRITAEVVSLREDQIAVIHPDVTELREFDEFEIKSKESNLTKRDTDKTGFAHFMLKEIFEQPKSIQKYIKKYLDVENGILHFPEFEEQVQKIGDIERIVIIAAGTSYYAGLVAEYIMESIGHIPVEIEYASEFRNKKRLISDKDLVIILSKSGEASDTVASFDYVKRRGVKILAICNDEFSRIGKEADYLIKTDIPHEFGLASSNVFTTQYFFLILIALAIAEKKESISKMDFRALLFEIESIPKKMEEVLDQSNSILKIAQKYSKQKNIALFGRSANYSVAREGAHILRKIACVHSESYPAAEVKDGPIALIDEGMPAIMIATGRRSYKKIVRNTKEIIDRKGKVIAIIKEGDELIKNLTPDTVEMPHISDDLMPFLTILPIQLLSYYIAIEKNLNIDSSYNNEY